MRRFGWMKVVEENVFLYVRSNRVVAVTSCPIMFTGSMGNVGDAKMLTGPVEHFKSNPNGNQVSGDSVSRVEIGDHGGHSGIKIGYTLGECLPILLRTSTF